jgi:hypothetical protein
MKRATVVLFLTFALSSCAAVVPQPLIWTKENVSGLTLIAEDEKSFQQLSFHANGSVSITVGPKGGPHVGPLYEWSIVEERLQIGTGANTEQLTLISRDAERIVVRRRSGSVGTYAIVKN